MSMGLLFPDTIGITLRGCDVWCKLSQLAIVYTTRHILLETFLCEFTL